MSRIKENIYNVLKGKFLVKDGSYKNWLVLIFVVVLLLFMIASSHSVDKKIIKIAKLNKELRELKAEFVDVRSIAMKIKLESSVREKLKDKGIVPSENPPYKIVVTKNKE